MPVPPLTVDEVSQTLKHSSLPTVVVEGRTDACVYRHLEGQLASTVPNVDFLLCGGRTTVLSAFARRGEVQGIRVAFVADRDMDLYTAGARMGCDGIVWTVGYSIENDLYDGSDIERFLDENERSLHSSVLEYLVRWFAFEVTEYRSGREFVVDVHVNVIVTETGDGFHPQFLKTRPYQEPPLALCAEIRKAYAEKIRGKQLFDALLRFLSATRRASKFSRANLVEICAKTRGHAKVTRLLNEVSACLA